MLNLCFDSKTGTSFFHTHVINSTPSFVLLCRPRFEHFDMPRSTYEQMDGDGGGGGMGDPDGGGDTPTSLDDYERPPLRHIDKYLKAELPCIHTARYTIAFMTCMGFIISFGMRCNMAMAKLSSVPVVSFPLPHLRYRTPICFPGIMGSMNCVIKY